MQLIISIVTPFDFPRQVEYSCVISLSAASLPCTITRRTSRHATIPNATAKSSPTIFTRGRRRARTSDLMIRSPLLDGTPYLIVHPIPASRELTPGYRIGEGQSGAIRQGHGRMGGGAFAKTSTPRGRGGSREPS